MEDSWHEAASRHRESRKFVLVSCCCSRDGCLHDAANLCQRSVILGTSVLLDLNFLFVRYISCGGCCSSSKCQSSFACDYCVDGVGPRCVAYGRSTFTISLSLHVAFSRALASQVSDKCAPIPLADGEVSTRSALILHQSFHPLMSALHSLDLSETKDQDSSSSASARFALPSIFNTLSSPSEPAVPSRSVSNVLLLPTLHRLLITTSFCVKWCQVKATQFLKDRSLEQFLLVTQSDLKVVLFFSFAI